MRFTTKTFFALIVAFAVSLSCNDENFKGGTKASTLDLSPEEVKRLVLLDSNFVYPMAKATQDALEIASELDEEDAKQGNRIKRSIGEVISYSIPDTIFFPGSTGRKNDPGFYVFNFSDKNGYAIISGDKRTPVRLGWAGKGMVKGNETDPGARIFLNRIVPYFQFRRQEVASMRGDSLHISLLQKLSAYGKDHTQKRKDENGRVEIPCIQIRTSNNAILTCDPGCTLYTSSYLASTSTKTTIVVSPLLKTEWNQFAPYNNLYAEGCNYVQDACFANSNYLAGCVPVSEAQVIAYFYAKNPAKYGTDWITIAGNKTTCFYASDLNKVSAVSALVKRVYDHYWLTAKYCGFLGGTGTFTFNHDILGLNGDRGIHPDFGLVQGEWRDYNYGDLSASIRNGSPVPVQGAQHELCLFFNFGCIGDPTSYHQWVMDGILTHNSIATYVVFPVNYTACTSLPSYTYTTNTIIDTYIHSNWGWGEGKNGWYLEGAFGERELYGQGAQSGNVYSYNHEDKIIAYVTPL